MLKWINKKPLGANIYNISGQKSHDYCLTETKPHYLCSKANYQFCFIIFFFLLLLIKIRRKNKKKLCKVWAWYVDIYNTQYVYSYTSWTVYNILSK